VRKGLTTHLVGVFAVVNATGQLIFLTGSAHDRTTRKMNKSLSNAGLLLL